MTHRIAPRALILFFLLATGLPLAAPANAADPLPDALQWREVGPYRGGRSAAVAGIPEDRETYYFGATGGGVWKTSNAGGKWTNVSDGFFGGSIGAVAVSAWDPSVVYVGGGEKTVRGNVSHGNGMWKSTDAGRSWTFIGLPDSRHISRIRIHPKDPDTAYVAVMGHLFGPNTERGVYRTRDGGANWERVLFVNDQAGAVDLIMDPGNPRILYATTWRILRTPYSLESGGDGSAIWKSTDSGDSWTLLSDKPGMPAPPLGISGITVSPSNPDNLYAIVEAAEGGVFRSRDAGESWERVNEERKLRQRAWYYSRINADPVDEEAVYVSNVRFHRSSDGGRSFSAISTPHADNHDLWIDPADPQRMIQANDGGANVSFDQGETWSTQSNQPTAQMYRVSVDNDFPYRLLGGQQDNSAVRIRSRSARGAAISTRDWEPTAGGESGHIVAHPDNPDIVYGGSYGGYLMRMDHANGDRRIINVWPDNPMGWGAAELKYRFNWNFPILFSPHDPDTLYVAANVLFKTRDEGQTWTTISPDLTRNIKEKQQSSGGPITKDNTSVEYYGTVFAIAESPLQAGVLWAGSDDGLVHVSQDGGENWAAVTPKGLPREIQINSIEPHPSEPGGLYLAATAYKSDDFAPYLYRTSNYGKSWKKIVRGIPEDHFTRVIRADREQAGLLYAGTESGVYYSSNDGDQWQPLQQNLPHTPVTDLALKSGNLIAATQGRGYWIFDDLHQLKNTLAGIDDSVTRLYPPAPAYRLSNGTTDDPGAQGTNPANGVVFYYHLPEEVNPGEPFELVIKDSADRAVKTLTLNAGEDAEKLPEHQEDNRKLPGAQGLNRYVWDLRYPAVEGFKDMVLWNSGLDGPRALPGDYTATLNFGDSSSSTPFKVLADPRTPSSLEDLTAQFEFVLGLNQKLTETHQAIRDIRATRAQVQGVMERAAADERYADLVAEGEALVEALTAVEETLYQTRMESRQDPLNFPIRLNDKLAGVMGVAAFGDHRPTAASLEVSEELVRAIDDQLALLEVLKTDQLSSFNDLARELALPAVVLTQHP